MSALTLNEIRPMFTHGNTYPVISGDRLDHAKHNNRILTDHVQAGAVPVIAASNFPDPSVRTIAVVATDFLGRIIADGYKAFEAPNATSVTLLVQRVGHGDNLHRRAVLMGDYEPDALVVARFLHDYPRLSLGT